MIENMSNFNLRAIYITPILVAYRKFWQIFFSKWRIFKNKMSTISPPILIINLPWGHVGSHTIFGPDWFSRFDVYGLLTDRQAFSVYTMLSGSFAPIFYLNCEHFLFVFIAKQKQQKSSRIC